MHNEMNKMVSKLHNHKHNIYICTSNQVGHNSLVINKKKGIYSEYSVYIPYHL